MSYYIVNKLFHHAVVEKLADKKTSRLNDLMIGKQ